MSKGGSTSGPDVVGAVCSVVVGPGAVVAVPATVVVVAEADVVVTPTTVVVEPGTVVDPGTDVEPGTVVDPGTVVVGAGGVVVGAGVVVVGVVAGLVVDGVDGYTQITLESVKPLPGSIRSIFHWVSRAAFTRAQNAPSALVVTVKGPNVSSARLSVA